ncbi:hypothetical protein [uncultured Microbacterium sp.]|uniref:hypothetical protein n=1 Tax=uncultured Microbacterium sp. TaxID=191216 RepID=UPI0025DF411F|nr:hypothetical protein [uncultured Microbacterium sp.]
MTDEQFAVFLTLTSVLTFLLFMLACLYIFGVIPRRRRESPEQARRAVEAALSGLDFSRIRAGALTAERIYAEPKPVPMPQGIAELHEVVEFRGVTYPVRKDGSGFYLIEGPNAGDTFTYRGEPWRASIGSSNMVGPVRHIIAHPVW